MEIDNIEMLYTCIKISNNKNYYKNYSTVANTIKANMVYLITSCVVKNAVYMLGDGGAHL